MKKVRRMEGRKWRRNKRKCNGEKGGSRERKKQRR